MSPTNPFAQQYVVMKFPPDSSGTLSIEGFHLEADEHGCIDLPRQLQKAAESHGLFVSDRPEKAKK